MERCVQKGGLKLSEAQKCFSETAPISTISIPVCHRQASHTKPLLKTRRLEFSKNLFQNSRVKTQKQHLKTIKLKTSKQDISILVETGHFYFGLTCARRILDNNIVLLYTCTRLREKDGNEKCYLYEYWF